MATPKTNTLNSISRKRLAAEKVKAGLKRAYIRLKGRLGGKKAGQSKTKGKGGSGG